MNKPKITWDKVVSLAGLVGFFHEIESTNNGRPLVIGACVVFVLIPFPAALDRFLARGRDK